MIEHKNEEIMMKHSELLEQLTVKRGEIAESHVSLARERIMVAHTFGQISNRLDAIEQNQRAAQEADLGNGLLPAPAVCRKTNRQGHMVPPLPDGSANRQQGSYNQLELKFPL
ncbi:hypothetical protein RND71_003825 [Anisodus tanguticus]|uniref:Uncharacterized protein n=1 Tax=Anisodus tanguticus TaxID=243964 RepID=A0AAE1VWY4_9SOLA|nr:hypothetical protein RND71_003825 [Anisodus tanguticus]